jgi:hypothetical protein
LDRIELERDKAFVADRGYDAVDIIQKILNKGLKSAIKVKETVRMRIRNPSRQLAKRYWKEYGKERYSIEQLFGSVEAVLKICKFF